MQRSETIGKLAAALAAAQGEFPAIVKDRTAKVAMKAGGTYTYQYTDLASIIAAVQPFLAKHGIAHVEEATNDGAKVAARAWLFHSGEWMCSDPITVLASDDKPQSIGSAATYAKRYALSGMLGIAPEEDDDGTLAQSRPATTSAARPAKSRTEELKSKVQDAAAALGGEVTETIERARTAGQPLWPFGEDKGKPLSAITVKSLQWGKSRFAANLKDPEKEKWRADNEALLAATEAELARRGTEEAA